MQLVVAPTSKITTIKHKLKMVLYAVSYKKRVNSVLQFPYIKHQKNYNFKFSVTPRFTLKSSMLWFSYRVKHFFKTDLLKNPCGICSSTVDLKVGNSLSHEVKQKNWLKNKSHCKLLRYKAEIKQKEKKISVIST